MPTLLFRQSTIGLHYMAGLLSPEDCQQLIQIGQQHMRQAEVVDENTGKSIPHPDRQSQMAWPKREDYPILQNISRGIAQLTNIPAENQEPLQILRYGVGGEYKPHFDAFDAQSDNLQTGGNRHQRCAPLMSDSVNTKIHGNRIATLILYLNNVPQGGGTAFPKLGVETAALAGCGVFFFNLDKDKKQHPLSLHAGLPVLSGEKWIATCWIRERAYAHSESRSEDF